MTDKRKVSAAAALTVGGGLNIAVVCGFFYDAGLKAKEIESLKERTNAHEAMIVNSRQDLGDKLDKLSQAVARIEGQLERRK